MVRLNQTLARDVMLPSRSDTIADEVTRKSPPPSTTDVSSPTVWDPRPDADAMEARSIFVTSGPNAPALPVTPRHHTEIDGLPPTETASETASVSPLGARLLQVTPPNVPSAQGLKGVLAARRRSIQALRQQVEGFGARSLQPEIRLKTKTVASLQKTKKTLERKIDKTKAKQDRNRIFAALLGGFDAMLIGEAAFGTEDQLAGLRKEHGGVVAKSAALTSELSPLLATMQALQRDLKTLKTDEQRLTPLANRWMRPSASPVKQFGHAITALDNVKTVLERQVRALTELSSVEGDFADTLDALVTALNSEIAALKADLADATVGLFDAAVEVVAKAVSPAGNALLGDFSLEVGALTGPPTDVLAAKILEVCSSALDGAPAVLRQRTTDQLVALMTDRTV